MNSLCANSVKAYEAHAIYVDASNSADPYLIAKLTRARKNDPNRAKKILDSIFVIRAFTCYQLYDIVAKQLPRLASDRKANSVFISGVDYLFNEQDNSEAEIKRLQILMSSALSSIANDKKSGIDFVVASAKKWLEHFVLPSKVTIKFSERKATLMKSDEMQFDEAFI